MSQSTGNNNPLCFISFSRFIPQHHLVLLDAASPLAEARPCGRYGSCVFGPHQMSVGTDHNRTCGGGGNIKFNTITGDDTGNIIQLIGGPDGDIIGLPFFKGKTVYGYGCIGPRARPWHNYAIDICG